MKKWILTGLILASLALIMGASTIPSSTSATSNNYITGLGIVILALIGIIVISISIFWVWMIIDCVKRKFKDKVVWIIVLIFTHILGASLYYFYIKRKNVIN